jgi:hypothetical protein
MLQRTTFTINGNTHTMDVTPEVREAFDLLAEAEREWAALPRISVRRLRVRLGRWLLRI